jgi:hypothetical protein
MNPTKKTATMPSGKPETATFAPLFENKQNENTPCYRSLWIRWKKSGETPFADDI